MSMSSLSHRTAAGIIPFSVYRGDVYFLLGKEPSFHKTGGTTWCAFEGGADPDDSSEAHTAARECVEETMGCVFPCTPEKLADSLERGEYYTKAECNIPHRSHQERKCILYAKYVECDPYSEVRFRELRSELLSLRSQYDRLIESYPSIGHNGAWGVAEIVTRVDGGFRVDDPRSNRHTVLARDDLSQQAAAQLDCWLDRWSEFAQRMGSLRAKKDAHGAVELVCGEDGALVQVHFRAEWLEKTSMIWWCKRNIEDAFRWRRTRKNFRTRFVTLMSTILNVFDKNAVHQNTRVYEHANFALPPSSENGMWPRASYRTPDDSPTTQKPSAIANIREDGIGDSEPGPASPLARAHSAAARAVTTSARSATPGETILAHLRPEIVG